MEKIVFFWEWLRLPKEEFNILMMLADMGGCFKGNLSDMCRYFRVDPGNSKNKAPMRTAILSFKRSLIVKEKRIAILLRSCNSSFVQK